MSTKRARLNRSAPRAASAPIVVDALVAQRIVDAVCALPSPARQASRNRRLARLRGVSRAFARVVPVVEPPTLKAMYGMVRAHALFANAALTEGWRVRERFAAYTLKCGAFRCMRTKHVFDAKTQRAMRAARTMFDQSRVANRNGPAPCVVLARDAVRIVWHALFRATNARWALHYALQQLDAKPLQYVERTRQLTDDDLRAYEARLFKHVCTEARTIRTWHEHV